MKKRYKTIMASDLFELQKYLNSEYKIVNKLEITRAQLLCEDCGKYIENTDCKCVNKKIKTNILKDYVLILEKYEDE